MCYWFSDAFFTKSLGALFVVSQYNFLLVANIDIRTSVAPTPQVHNMSLSHEIYGQAQVQTRLILQGVPKKTGSKEISISFDQMVTQRCVRSQNGGIFGC